MITINGIIDQFGSPIEAYDRAQNVKPNENGFYLYELYETFNFWESKTWFFNDLKEFYDYAYSHELFEYIEMDENYEEYEDYFENTDLTALNDKIQSYKNKEWAVEDCQRFVKTFKHSSFEIIQFGIIADFFNASEEEIQKCKHYFSSKEDLEKNNLPQGFYQIMYDYLSCFNEHPKENKQKFLDYISDK